MVDFFGEISFGSLMNSMKNSLEVFSWVYFCWKSWPFLICYKFSFMTGSVKQWVMAKWLHHQIHKPLGEESVALTGSVLAGCFSNFGNVWTKPDRLAGSNNSDFLYVSKDIRKVSASSSLSWITVLSQLLEQPDKTKLMCHVAKLCTAAAVPFPVPSSSPTQAEQSSCFIKLCSLSLLAVPRHSVSNRSSH